MEDGQIVELVTLTAELEQCIPDGRAGAEWEQTQLTRLLDAFLETLSRENRMIFVRRYWAAEPVRNIAKAYQISESKVKSSLFRTRNKLRAYLEQEGVEV